VAGSTLPDPVSGLLEVPIPDRSTIGGLEAHRGPRKRVVVIGAGMAGLGAAFELAEMGHDPVVLEAQNRVGGRLLTLRCFAPGLYAEAGAMRIPRVHTLTLDYCRRLGVALRPFIMDCPQAPMYLAGRRVTYAQVESDPELMPLGLAAHEHGRSWAELWSEATREIRERYERDGDSALAALGRDYDDYSIRRFLVERGFSEEALEIYGLMSLRESNMRASVVEHLREIVGRAFEDMQEVVGGMDQLPAGLYKLLRSQVRMGAHVFAVEQDADGVTVRYRSHGGATGSVRGDHCICTVPFGVLRHLDFRPALSRGKYRAIRELNYNPSTKILLQVRTRFWEKQGIRGGRTVTDLPIRRIVYPSHPPVDEDPRGVLLASYTWGQDAARWGALSPDDRIDLAIRDVAKIHPEIREECEGGASYAWYDDPYAVGAFALFEPGQETGLHTHIVSAEGRVHFAGEHCSLWHAWIEGALESGLRAAAAVQAAP
jgi:monoamine oxidase